MKKILITGGAGYIGNVLARQLIHGGYSVTVVDKLIHDNGASILDLYENQNFEFKNIDIKDISDLFGIEAVVHLAAIVGEKACNRNPTATYFINCQCTQELYHLANQCGVKKFIFASTCSNYGENQAMEYLAEDSILNPVSVYANSKIDAENFLLNQDENNICKPTVLRFATAYGISPRMRFDLTVNDFTAQLASGKKLTVYEKNTWRPYCHILDISKAIKMIIESDTQKTAFQVFNVGSTTENYTKEMIVNKILKFLPDAEVRYIDKKIDKRNYRVSFEKIKNEIGFLPIKTISDTIQRIIELLKNKVITDIEDRKYYND